MHSSAPATNLFKMNQADLYTAFIGSDKVKIETVSALASNAMTFSQTRALGIAPHIIAATNAIGSELRDDQAQAWPAKVASTIRTGSKVGRSWWLFAQWMLGKILQMLPKDSAEYEFCEEVEMLYYLGCDNIQAWQDLIARMDSVPVEEPRSAFGAAVIAYKQLAQSALILTEASGISLDQISEAHNEHIVKSLDLACQALLHQHRFANRNEVFQRLSTKFLHAISKG